MLLASEDVKQKQNERTNISASEQRLLVLQCAGEIKRSEVVLDHQVSLEEIMSPRWSWAVKVGPFLLQVVTQQRCNGRCPCDSALAQQLKQH